MKNYIITIFILLLSNSGFAQTGPGGVGSDANNTLWLDASTLSQSNGDPVSSWTDESGNSNSPTQLSSTSQPVMRSNQINLLPAIEFDGTNDRLEFPVSISDAENTTFIVANSVRDSYSSIMSLNKHHFSFGAGLFRSEFSDGRKIIEKLLNNYSIISSTTGSNLLNGTVDLTNGNSSRSLSRTSFYSITNQAVGALFYSGQFNFHLDGLIAEIIVYNENLNSASRKIVSNYLASKYNLTGESNLYNYAATNGNNVMGIGREADGSNLTAKGRDSLRISNAIGLSNGEYLLVGNNGNDFGTSVSVPSGIIERWNRVWRVDITGTVESIDLEFFIGSSGFAASNDYVIIVENNDGDFSNGGASFITTTPTLSSGVLKFVGVSIPDGAYFTLAESTSEIQAILDGNWNSPTTWDCNCVPGSGRTVKIPSPIAVKIQSNSDVLDLNILDGGSLEFLGTDTLNIYGNLDITGSFTAGLGTISTKSLALNQSFGNNSGNIVNLNNLHLSSANTVFVNNNDWTISGNLQVENGQLNVSSTSSFTLLSNALTTAQILPSVENSLIGDFTIERFISSRNANYANFSSPMVSATVNELDDDLSLSGIGGVSGNATASGGGIFFSIKTYNRFSEAHENVTSTTAVLEPGNGYEIYLASTLSTFNATTVDLVGTPTTGELSSTQVNQGWNLIGNPYQSSLSWTNVTKHSSVPLDFYIFNTNNGSYDLINGGTDPIAPGQGFWINMLLAGGKTITFNEDDKFSSNSSTFLRKKNVNLSSFTLSSKNNPYSTKVFVNFDVNSSNKTDYMDAPFLPSPIENVPAIYSKAELNSSRLTRNSVSQFEETLNIPFIVDIPEQGFYTIESDNLQNILTNYSCSFIKDNINNEIIDLQFSDSFSFEADVGISDRFQLILSNSFEDCEKELSHISSNTFTQSKLALRNNGKQIYIDYYFHDNSNHILSIEIMNLNGQTVKLINDISVIGRGSSSLIGSNDLKEGIYVVRVVGNDATLSEIIKL